jgi:single-strand DNA-binding protein
MNSVNITGRITKDPFYKPSSEDKKSFCAFRIADDEENETTYFFDVVCFKTVADSVGKYCKKGDLVGVSGKLVTRSDGEREKIEISAQRVDFLSSKKKEEKVEGPGFRKSALAFSDPDLPF